MALVAFDFDGTLTQSDLTVLLGREYDVASEIRGLAEQGLRGEVEFARTLRQRAALLEGMPEHESTQHSSAANSVRALLTFSPTSIDRIYALLSSRGRSSEGSSKRSTERE